MRRAVALVAASLLVLLAAASAGAHSTATRLTHVTFIGDSVPEGVAGDSAAMRILSAGIDLDMQAATCRRLEDPSCPPNPPTAVQLIHQLGPSIGPVVVISVGYNDFVQDYAKGVEDTLQALEAANVQKVFWLTLREAQHQAITQNAEIESAAQKHREVTVVDWNMYSRSHLDWFQNDGIHLLAAGSEAMATLVHKKLLQAGVAVPPPRFLTKKLPAARAGTRYAVRLRAASGLHPYRFAVLGHVPLGLHFTAVGTLAGVPRASDARGVYTLVFRVTDASGQSVTRKLLLRLR
jgi:hypothetical protein